jgi:hypothetical protein
MFTHTPLHIYKSIKIKNNPNNTLNNFKVTKWTPKKFRNSAGKTYEIVETGSTHCSTRHWRREGSRTVTDGGNKTGGLGTSSPFLSSYAGSKGHDHLQQGKRKHTSN